MRWPPNHGDDRPLCDRRRHQRRRHRARRRRPRPVGASCARRTISREGTSSRSGKLVHGGLRYLEYYEFRLVREALIEREVLLNAGAAHHLADALRAAAQPEERPALAGAARPVSLRSSRRPQEAAGHAHARSAPRARRARRSSTSSPRGFEYSDCWVDDARLVVLNALDAAERGAVVLTRTAVHLGAPARDGALACRR